MSNTEFDISMQTWLSGDGENYKVLRLSRFGKQFSVWVQNYVLNDYPNSLYDACYIESGEATLHEMFATKGEAMEVAEFVVDHYKMNKLEDSLGVINS